MFLYILLFPMFCFVIKNAALLRERRGLPLALAGRVDAHAQPLDATQRGPRMALMYTVVGSWCVMAVRDDRVAEVVMVLERRVVVDRSMRARRRSVVARGQVGRHVVSRPALDPRRRGRRSIHLPGSGVVIPSAEARARRQRR